MLAIDRQRKILDLLHNNGSIRTMDTAAELGVTDETVRKDFEILERRGDLVRTHGGASRPLLARIEQPFDERQAVRREEKEAIARLAVSRIQANETIFLDASSSALTLAGFLQDIPLTIITNALNIFTALSDRQNIHLISTGGLYDPVSRSFIGLTAEKALRGYNIDRMFFSANGLHLDRGISESNARQAAFKERVVEDARDVVLLADHSKLGQKSAFFFAELDRLGCLITDKKADAGFLHSLRAGGVEVVQEGAS